MATFTCSNLSLGNNYYITATLYVSAYRISSTYVRVELSNSSSCSLTPKLHDYYVGVYATHSGVTNRLHYISNSKSGGSFPYGYADFYDTDPTSTYSISLQIIDSYGEGYVAGTGSIGSYTFNVGSGSYTVSYNKNTTRTVSNMPDNQTKYYNTNLTLSSTKPTSSSDTTKYTWEFDGNGGKNATSLSANKTTKYTFSKWNTAANGSGTSYSAGGTYSSNSSATLYAQWTSSATTGTITPSTTTRNNDNPNGYKVTYAANGGTTTPSSSQAVDTVAYTFNNWNTKSDGKGTIYKAKTAYTPTSSLKLYAQWTSSTTKGKVTLASAIKKTSTSATGFSVNFYNTSGTDSLVTKTATNTIKYTFAGWKIGSTTYTAGTSYTPSSNVTATAQWTSSTTKGTIYAPSASDISSYTPQGKILAGWSTTKNGTTVSYNPGAAITPTGNMNLYAVFVTGSNYILVCDLSSGTSNGNKWSYAISGASTASDNNPTILWPEIKAVGINNWGTKNGYVTYNGNYIGKRNSNGTIVKVSINDGMSTGDTFLYKK